LLELIERIRRQVAREPSRPTHEIEAISCYEARYDGFWLHHLLEAHGVHNHVLDPASLLVNREIFCDGTRSDAHDKAGISPMPVHRSEFPPAIPQRVASRRVSVLTGHRWPNGRTRGPHCYEGKQRSLHQKKFRYRHHKQPVGLAASKGSRRATSGRDMKVWEGRTAHCLPFTSAYRRLNSALASSSVFVTPLFGGGADSVWRNHIHLGSQTRGRWVSQARRARLFTDDARREGHSEWRSKATPTLPSWCLNASRRHHPAGSSSLTCRHA
jgi:hypothetical protein